MQMSNPKGIHLKIQHAHTHTHVPIPGPDGDSLAICQPSDPNTLNIPKIVPLHTPPNRTELKAAVAHCSCLKDLSWEPPGRVSWAFFVVVFLRCAPNVAEDRARRPLDARLSRGLKEAVHQGPGGLENGLGLRTKPGERARLETPPPKKKEGKKHLGGVTAKKVGKCQLIGCQI